MKLLLTLLVSFVAFGLGQTPGQQEAVDIAPPPEDALYRGRDADSVRTLPQPRGYLGRLRSRVREAAEAEALGPSEAIDLSEQPGLPKLLGLEPKPTPIDM